jgi:hypothetical protein
MTARNSLPELRESMLVLASLVAASLGFAAGSLNLTGVEPRGEFVSCGPAVFGRPSTLPDVACGTAYNQLPIPLTFLTFALLAFSAVLLTAAVVQLIVRRRPTPASSVTAVVG